VKVLVFGLGAGAGFQAWRNYPPEGPGTPAGLWCVLVAGMVLAFLAGKSRRRGSAVATASAHAEASAAATAQQAVQVFIGSEGGHGPRPVGYAMPMSSAPWLATSSERPALDLDQLDGMELSDVLEDSDTERSAG
jgi:hypothetical protein